jgi:hypothetical protein
MNFELYIIVGIIGIFLNIILFWNICNSILLENKYIIYIPIIGLILIESFNSSLVFNKVKIPLIYLVMNLSRLFVIIVFGIIIWRKSKNV